MCWPRVTWIYLVLKIPLRLRSESNSPWSPQPIFKFFILLNFRTTLANHRRLDVQLGTVATMVVPSDTNYVSGKDTQSIYKTNVNKWLYKLYKIGQFQVFFLMIVSLTDISYWDQHSTTLKFRKLSSVSCLPDRNLFNFSCSQSLILQLLLHNDGEILPNVIGNTLSPGHLVVEVELFNLHLQTKKWCTFLRIQRSFRWYFLARGNLFAGDSDIYYREFPCDLGDLKQNLFS